MNLKYATLLLAAAFITLVLACGGVTEPKMDTPATLEARRQAVVVEGTGAPAPTSTVVPTQRLLLSTATTVTFNPDAVHLIISEPPSNTPDYNRKDWVHWNDDDGDCQDTRHEVLIEESLKDVEFKTERQCQVAKGLWHDPFTGREIEDSTELDIDHMVPLKNAHLSGAWDWDPRRKKSYANYMTDSEHLVAVTASANRQKGARGPEDWRPSNTYYWCEYATSWINIKIKWELTVTEEEFKAIESMVSTCEVIPSITSSAVRMKSPDKVDSLATQTPAPTPSDSGIQISAIDCKGSPEYVVIANSGQFRQDITGWEMMDEGAKNVYRFPVASVIEAGAEITLFSGVEGQDSTGKIYWSKRYVLNNDGDTAHLFNRIAELVSKKVCP